MQEEVENRAVTLVISATKLTARLLKAAVKASASRALKKTRYLGISPDLSFFRAKSTPYFRATRSKDLMLLSVISMLDTP